MSDPKQVDETERPDGMGVSSERLGHTGPGQYDTSGLRDTRAKDPHVEEPEAPPEQSPGNPEGNPQGLAPKAGYPSVDPRS